MAKAFARGMSLVDKEGLNYKVMTDRRESAGEVEIRGHYTGIIYAFEGAATFVTGRRIVHPKTVAPGEIRAESTQGGVPQRVERTASSWRRPARPIGLDWAIRHLLDMEV
jgi:hypothetical protein